MFELSKISVEQLNERFSAQAKWIANIAKGVDDEPVRARDKQTSIAISKNFPGVNALTTTEDVQFWLNGLAKELAKRLVEDQIKNERTACTLHVSCTTESLSNGAHLTKSCQIVSYASDAIYNACWAIMRHFNKSTVPSKWEPSIVNISLSATRFHDGIDQSSKRITEWINRRGEQLAAGKDSEPSSQSLHSAVSKTTTTPNTALVSSVMQDYCMTPVAEVRLDSRQIDDNSASAVAASSSGGAFLPNSLQEIPREMLAEMPEDIRRELSIYYHQKKVQERGALSPSSKSKTTSSPSSTKSSHRRSTNKRITRTSSSTNVEPKNMKKISDFFKKT
ncbi:unnamed protein product [Anisakis simplex]|uniref:DNA polymerase eta (inferred by orthology to a human protein) n=1 Tax=Anisakis simplex TaxID=6269 RepID=A0A0M3K4Q1_ANISI|nr:unnamed protein product [Anisakis simplex]